MKSTGHDVADRLCIIACAQSASNLLRFKNHSPSSTVMCLIPIHAILDVSPTTDHDCKVNYKYSV